MGELTTTAMVEHRLAISALLAGVAIVGLWQFVELWNKASDAEAIGPVEFHAAIEKFQQHETRLKQIDSKLENHLTESATTQSTDVEQKWREGAALARNETVPLTLLHTPS